MTGRFYELALAIDQLAGTYEPGGAYARLLRFLADSCRWLARRMP